MTTHPARIDAAGPHRGATSTSTSRPLVTSGQESICIARYVRGTYAGDPCRFRASVIINPRTRGLPPFRVCGYHARAYTADVRYPMSWNLSQIRRFQWSNVEAITR